MISREHAKKNMDDFRKSRAAKEVETTSTTISKGIDHASSLGHASYELVVEYYNEASIKTIVDTLKKLGYDVTFGTDKSKSTAGYSAHLVIKWS